MSLALALDPGLGTFGAAIVNGAGDVIDIDAIGTAPGEVVRENNRAKKAARAAGRKSAPRRTRPGNSTTDQLTDRDRRVRELLDGLDNFVEDTLMDLERGLVGHGRRVRVIIAEAGRAQGKAVGNDAIISLATGSTIVSTLGWRLGVPVVWATQLEWRRTLLPRPKSGRLGQWEQSEIEAGLGAVLVETTKSKLRARGKSITLRDHALDAAGMGRWGVGYSGAVRAALGLGEL